MAASLIWTGKGGYDSVRDFEARTRSELSGENPDLLIRDTIPQVAEIDFVQERLREVGGGACLELGCGLGCWAPVVKSAGFDYTGIDPVLARINYARKKYGAWSGEFSYGGVGTRFSRRFDAVLSVTVVQHLLMGDALRAVEFISAALRPGGRAILIESMLLDAGEEECDRLYADPKNPCHMVPKPLGSLKAADASLSWERVGDDKFIIAKGG